MSLNLKNPATYQLVRELAASTGETRTGETITEAVTEAVRERLRRLGSTRQESLSRHLLAIGRECAGRWKEPCRSIDHGELLYDENGLPK